MVTEQDLIRAIETEKSLQKILLGPKSAVVDNLLPGIVVWKENIVYVDHHAFLQPREHFQI